MPLKLNLDGSCVCGYDPKTDPNPDCERCMLIKRIAELEAELARRQPADQKIKGRSIGLDKTELDEEETKAFLKHIRRLPELPRRIVTLLETDEPAEKRDDK